MQQSLRSTALSGNRMLTPHLNDATHAAAVAHDRRPAAQHTGNQLRVCQEHAVAGCEGGSRQLVPCLRFVLICCRSCRRRCRSNISSKHHVATVAMIIAFCHLRLCFCLTSNGCWRFGGGVSRANCPEPAKWKGESHAMAAVDPFPHYMRFAGKEQTTSLVSMHV